MTDPVLGPLHQLRVDTYAAQHVGDDVPPINTAFALIGLHLALDEGRSGIDVRDTLQRLAAQRRTWPAFERPAPSHVPQVTILDIANAPSADAHIAAVERWARTVWEDWRARHAAVAAVLS